MVTSLVVTSGEPAGFQAEQDWWPPTLTVLRSMQWAIHAAFEKGEPLSMARQAKRPDSTSPIRLATQFRFKGKHVHRVLETS